MGKKKNNLLNVTVHETKAKFKKTSIGRNPSTSKLNKKKRKRRTRKQLKYKGQGKT